MKIPSSQSCKWIFHLTSGECLKSSPVRSRLNGYFPRGQHQAISSGWVGPSGCKGSSAIAAWALGIQRWSSSLPPFHPQINGVSGSPGRMPSMSSGVPEQSALKPWALRMGFEGECIWFDRDKGARILNTYGALFTVSTVGPYHKKKKTKLDYPMCEEMTSRYS